MDVVYRFGRFHFDARRLTRDGEPVTLGARACGALRVLIDNRSRVVAKEELAAALWPDRAVSEDAVPQTILTVRRALGDDSGQPRFIATIPRRGYRFIADVNTIEPGLESDAVPPADEPDLEHEQEQEPPPRWRRAWVAAVAFVAVACAVASAAMFMARRSADQDLSPGRPLRFTQRAPANTTLVSGGVLSPDGRSLAFVSEDDRTGQSQLWVRALASEEAQVIPDTDGASKPFWSPDSRWIGFFANERLKILPLERGTPQTVAVVGLSPEGAAWGPHGDILFARWKDGVSRIPANGGAPEAVTTLDHAAQENGHTQPQFLPDGRHFLYYVRSATPAKRGTYVGTVDGAGKVRLLAEHAVYAAPGFLLSISDGMLRAQPFDPDSLRLSGQPTIVAADVGRGTFLSAAGGDLLALGGAARRARLTWFDRTGRVTGTIDSPAPLHNPAFSPDLRLLMASSVEGGREGVWLVDLERGAPTRFTPHGTSPLLSPAGDRIVFTSDRNDGVADVYSRPAGGREEERVLLRTPENKIVNDWSPDGRYLVYVSTNATTNKDIWLLPTFGDRRPVRFLQTAFNEIQAKVSPDGRWVAYASDENGAFEVYIQSFPTPGLKQVISVNGGAQPTWRRDGRELFYLAPDHRIMSVEITPGTPLQVGKPRVLFRAPIEGGLNAYRSHYLPTADGQRFLIDMIEPDSHRDSIGVLVNWRALIR